MGLITKNKVLSLSLILGIVALIFGYISDRGQCFLGYGKCEPIAYTFLIFVPLFLLTIIFYFTKEQSFKTWIKFIFWWVPITIFLVILSPKNRIDFSPIEKKTTFLLMTIGLVFISLTIILYKSLKKDSN